MKSKFFSKYTFSLTFLVDFGCSVTTLSPFPVYKHKKENKKGRKSDTNSKFGNKYQQVHSLCASNDYKKVEGRSKNDRYCLEEKAILSKYRN